MSVRHNNKLPTNLPQLQNLIKRDPKSYTEEVSKELSLELSHFRSVTSCLHMCSKHITDPSDCSITCLIFIKLILQIRLHYTESYTAASCSFHLHIHSADHKNLITILIIYQYITLLRELNAIFLLLRKNTTTCS